VLINELLVVCDDRLGDGLTNSIYLRCVATAGNSDADIDACELVETNDEEGFVDLESQNLGLNKAERLSVDLNKSLTRLVHLISILRSDRSSYR
jgi:hypothetical protein